MGKQMYIAQQQKDNETCSKLGYKNAGGGIMGTNWPHLNIKDKWNIMCNNPKLRKPTAGCFTKI